MSKMKILLLFAIISVLFINDLYSQSNINSEFAKEFNRKLLNNLKENKYENLDINHFSKKYNLSKFFGNMNSEKIYGFIGNELERIKVKVLSVEQVQNTKTTFKISGKTKIAEKITVFNGNISLENIYSFQEKITRHGLVICEFKAELNETGNSSNLGTFIGYYYLILSKIAEDIRYPKATPRYLQNYTFAGNWKAKNKNLNLPVLWGENYLVEELETFYYEITRNKQIDENIIDKNWKSYFDAYTEGVKSSIKNKALKEEKSIWWK